MSAKFGMKPAFKGSKGETENLIFVKLFIFNELIYSISAFIVESFIRIMSANIPATYLSFLLLISLKQSWYFPLKDNSTLGVRLWCDVFYQIDQINYIIMLIKILLTIKSAVTQ